MGSVNFQIIISHWYSSNCIAFINLNKSILLVKFKKVQIVLLEDSEHKCVAIGLKYKVEILHTQNSAIKYIFICVNGPK